MSLVLDQRSDKWAAGVLFVTRDGLALFLHRVDNGLWSIPAGGVEDEDSKPSVCAQREAAEEVGYPGNFSLIQIDDRETNGVRFWTFLQWLPQPFDPILNDEHDQYVWAPVDEPPAPLHPGLLATLEFNKAQFGDAAPKPRRIDPTKTGTLRKAFRATLQMRFRKVRALLRTAVIDHDMLGLGLEKHQYIAPTARLATFNSWFEAMARTELAGGWTYAWITKAINSGERMALRDIHGGRTLVYGHLDHLYEATQSELNGIAAALVQQVSRAAAQVVATRRTVRPAAAFRLMQQPFAKIGKQRLDPFAHDAITKAHVKAMLAVYRANQVEWLGVEAEALPRTRVKDAYDPGEARDPSGKWTSGGSGETENRKPYQSVIIDRNRDGHRVTPFEVLVNPSRHDAMALLRESDYGSLRVTRDEAGNVYAWDGGAADHGDVWHHFDIGGGWNDEWLLLRGRMTTSSSGGMGDAGRAKIREWLRDAVHFHDQDEELWGSLTAGDDDVCEDCQDIADDAPYTIDELEDLIPAHPRCRCKPYPFYDLRYAGELGLRTRAQQEAQEDFEDALTHYASIDAYDPSEERDPHGRWTSGGGGAANIVHAYHGGQRHLSAMHEGVLFFSKERDVAESYASEPSRQRKGSTATVSEADIDTSHYAGEDEYREIVEKIKPDWVEHYPSEAAAIDNRAVRAELKRRGFKGVKSAWDFGFRHDFDEVQVIIAIDPATVRFADGRQFVWDYDPDEERDPQGRWTTGGNVDPRAGLLRARPSSGYSGYREARGGHHVDPQAGFLRAPPPGGYTPGGYSEAPSGGAAITAYHGSHADILDSVRQNGLTVRGHSRNFETGMYHGERGESMYLADQEAARNWAIMATHNYGHSKPIVFEIKIPVEQKFKLRQEEDYQRFVGNIPPNWISGYSVFSKKKGRWKKFRKLWKDAALGNHFYLAMLVNDPDEEDFGDALTIDYDPNEERDPHGRWTSGGSVEFVSPNVGNLSFEQAVSGLHSGRQTALRQASSEIDTALKLKSTHADVVGAWSDGAENSVMDAINNIKWTEWNKIVASASMKGWLADQKSVLAFQETPVRKPPESVAVDLGYGKFQVEVNPSERDLRSMVRDLDPSVGARVLVDADGNLYAWDAMLAIHSAVAQKLNLDERHEDIWFERDGRLVSQRFGPYYERGSDKIDAKLRQRRIKEGTAEVRSVLDSLEGNSVLLSFEAKGKLEDIHKALLADGLAFHTLQPHKDGATVYAVATDPKDVKATVATVEKAAGRYGGKITYHHGRGEFIGNLSDAGSDREQRDHARSIYESNIRQYELSRGKEIWAGIRHHWQSAFAAQKVADDAPFNPELHPHAGSGPGGGRFISTGPHVAPAELSPAVHAEMQRYVTSYLHGIITPHQVLAAAEALGVSHGHAMTMMLQAAHEASRLQAAQAAEQKHPGKKKVEIADFDKDEIVLDRATRVDTDKQKDFIELWNDRIAEAPAEFRNEFLGGLKATMKLEYYQYDDHLEIKGDLLDENENRIGEYTRDIDFTRNQAESSYFKLYGGHQHADVGKQMLAANMALYQKLGIDKVKVHANIDVGGYAWAKYGYVPNENSWGELTVDLDKTINNLAGGDESYTEAGSWEELSDRQQTHIENAWRQATHDEFYDSEVESWRDSGQALEEVKHIIISEFETAKNVRGTGSDWAKEAIAAYRESREEKGQSPIPFTDKQILNALSLEFESRYGDGRGDVDVDFDDEELTEPKDFDPAQQTLPGFEVRAPHEYLTEEMREGLSKILVKRFNREAESKADDVGVPDYIADNVDEMQGEYWSSMDDRDRYRWAERHEPDLLGGGERTGTGEMSEADAHALRKLTASNDPKAIWAIADSKWGKKLLLGTDWNGAIDMDDKETMARFQAYVGKAKKTA